MPYSHPCLVIPCDDLVGGLPIAIIKERQARISCTPLVVEVAREARLGLVDVSN